MLVVYSFLFLSLLIFIYNLITIYQQAHYQMGLFLRYMISYIDEIVVKMILSIMMFSKNSNIILSIAIFSFLWELINLRKYKVKLKYTKRIIRLIVISLMGLIIVYYYLPFYGFFILYLIGIFKLMELLEKLLSIKYLKRARRKLKKFDGDIVAITGSYGKTTTKMYMAQLLRSIRPFYTKRSFNTPLGIAKSINENEIDINNSLILEFGASHRKDISYLCKLYTPNIAVVTAIGYMHLNTFKNITNIINEKMQIIDLLPKNGLGILNYDNEYIRNYQVSSKAYVITYGFSFGDFRISNFDNNKFVISYYDLRYEFKHNDLTKIDIYNLIPGIIIAIYNGISLEKISNEILTIKRPANRLSIQKFKNFSIIDDSFNSNIEGVKNALELLGNQNNLRYVITPGIVDNDKILSKLYKMYCKYLKENTDIVIIINSPSGRKLYKMIDSAIMVDSLKEAYYLFFNSNINIDKSLLIENDLPDIYERMKI